MKVVAVVPIKLNSTRLPQKNIKKFTNGKELCWYVLSTLMEVSGIDDVYVYCSSADIKQYIPDKVSYLCRNESLDTDTASINEVLYSFAHDVDADIYCMAHTTAPFISAKSIQSGLDAVISGKFDSAFSCKKLQDFLWKDGSPLNYELNNIPRTQDLPVLYQETSSFYIYRKDIILDKRRRIGERPYIVEVGEIEGIDIDEQEDFIIADALYNYKFLNR